MLSLLKAVKVIPICLVHLFAIQMNGFAADTPTIRVLVMKADQPITLTIQGSYTIQNTVTKKKLAVSSDLIGVRMFVTGNQLKIAGVSFPDQVDILPSSTNRIRVNNYNFRGFLRATRNPDNSVSLVNILSVDHYLYGVLMKEVGEWWPAEALKAQAVAARTYALYQIKTQANQSFDVYNNQFSQMYGGANSENPRGNSAVDDTRGEVLLYQGQIFPTFYHATCGGVTRSANDLWDIDIPPLAGGTICQSCWFSPHYSWDAAIPLFEVRQSLVNFLSDIDDPITDVTVLERTSQNRVKTIAFSDAVKQRVVPSKNFRSNLGTERVRSDVFEMSLKNSELRLKGHGWGHGVGMCQWGALGLSIFRKKYTEILSFYYPDSELIKQYW